jgi:hypothetical protein
MSLPKLTAAEVEFDVKVEWEHDILPEDSFEFPEDMEAVRKGIKQNNVYAWCCVRVIARWEGLEGWDVLGGISCHNRTELEEIIKEHGMRTNALAHLNERVPKTRKVNGWDKADFIYYLENRLIPDLKESGRDATAEDFETAVAFMRQS